MRNLFTVLFFCVANIAMAQSHQVALKKYLTEDVVAVEYLDLTQIDPIGVLEWVNKMGVGPEAKQRAPAMQRMLSLQSQLDKANDLGARYIYALFRVTDMSHGGPTWVVPIAKGGDANAVLEMVLSSPAGQFKFARDSSPVFEVVEGAVLGANCAEQMELLKESNATNSRDLSDAWKSLGNGHCGLIVFGDRDSRRVTRELFPKLPVPFQAIDGPFIADRLLWGGVVANFPPEPAIQVIIQTDANSTAQVLQQAAASGMGIVKQIPEVQQILSSNELDALVDSLAPSVSGGQLEISFANVFSDIERITKLLAPPLKAARLASQRSQRMNKFKHIALAVHNYISANKVFPPRGTFSEDGKPLLSWRVHILPYLGQVELYDQFHLDEPWDSEHNKQLIPLMPDVYADPDPALSERNAAGRTTYVVPTGLGAIYEKPAGTTFKEITDGTSDTIMLVEVWSMSAPFWTRPKDWVVDPSNPWERLKRRDGRDFITTAFCDGSVRLLPTSTTGEKLHALTTIAGEEVIE